MPPSITIQVPGTTANLGPGYDCLGVALGIYNYITVSKSAAPRRPFHGGRGSRGVF